MATRKKKTEDLTKQHGIVSRFFFVDDSVKNFEQVELSAGQGVVFFSGYGDYQEFEEKDRDEVLIEAVKREDFQAFAIVSTKIRGLYLSDGEHHIGVGTEGVSAAGMAPTNANTKYGLVWGLTAADAAQKIEEMKPKQTEPN